MGILNSKIKGHQKSHIQTNPILKLNNLGSHHIIFIVESYSVLQLIKPQPDRMMTDSVTARKFYQSQA